MNASEPLIRAHFDAIEAALTARGNVAGNAGHPIIKGGPREWFIRDFLADHLPSEFEIGRGEIIDSKSIAAPSSSECRNENDIVIHRRDFPKIAYSKEHSAFLAESVLGTVEVKSWLTKEELTRACLAARRQKSLDGAIIHCYLVAYSAKSSIKTISRWLGEIRSKESIDPEHLIDFMVILGQGTVFRSDVYSSLKLVSSEGEVTQDSGEEPWIFIEQTSANLLLLFFQLLSLYTRNWDRPYFLARKYLGGMSFGRGGRFNV